VAPPTEPESNPAAAEAEPATPTAEVQVVPDAQTNELGEIVVTANRRETTLQKYAGTVTALTQQDLDRKGFKSVRDIATPAVEIGTQESNVEIYIRGIGSDYDTELGDPAVATHIDGVYIPRPRGMGSMLFDIERLEIAEGPQGTLRGRNAVAGSLNIITAKPVFDEWLGEATMQLGNYSQRLLRGMVNVPIAEHLALRLAGFGEVHEPFYKNAGPVYTLSPAESADSLAYRASLLYEPIKAVKITLQHDYTQEKGTGYSGSNYYGALHDGLLPNEVPDPRAVIYRGPQPYQDLKHLGVHGVVNVDLGPVELEYLGSYRDLTYHQVSAGNAGVAYPGEAPQAVDDWGTSYWNTSSKSVVQELRLFAPDSARLRWTAGGFFFNESQRAFLGTTVDNSNSYFGQEYNMPSVKDHAYAGYIDAIFDILESWRATGGVRVSTDSKSRDGIGYSYSVNGITTPQRFGTEGFQFKEFGRTDYTPGGGSPTSDLVNGIASFGARDTLQNALAQPGVSLDATRLLEQHGSYQSKFVDFRIGTDYDITDKNLLYVMFSTGHKSGGFNDNELLPSGQSVAPTYKPEALYSTELGSKNKFLNGKLITNVAAFWYEYRNQQFTSIEQIVSSGIADKAGSSSSVRYNAAASRVLGLEANTSARLPLGLGADLGGLLMDARFVNGQVADTRLGYDAGSQPIVNIDGNRLPRAPVLSLNYGLHQSIPTSVGKFDWSVSAQTRTAQYMTVFNGNGRDSAGNVNPNLSDRVPSYTKLDASVGYTPSNNRLRLEVFVLNLSDVVYMTTLINTPNLNLRFFNPPRQYGMRLTVML
jgi:iron complex outermembrane receptor protein